MNTLSKYSTEVLHDMYAFQFFRKHKEFPKKTDEYSRLTRGQLIRMITILRKKQ